MQETLSEAAITTDDQYSREINEMLLEMQFIRKSIAENRALAKHHLDHSRIATAEARRMLTELQREP